MCPDLVAVVEEDAGARRSGGRRRQFAPGRHGRESCEPLYRRITDKFVYISLLCAISSSAAAEATGRFYYLPRFTSELYNLPLITWAFSICHTLHQFFSYLPYLSLYSFINFFNSEIHCEIQYLVLIPGWTKPGPMIGQPNW
jgi:hypothetical protein